MTDHQVEDRTEPDDEGDVTEDRADDDAADAAADAPAGQEAEAADAAKGGDADAEDKDEAGDHDDAPPEEKDRLQALQEDIDEVRRRVADPLDDGDRTFIEEGEADKDQPVDDTIAPPG